LSRELKYHITNASGHTVSKKGTMRTRLTILTMILLLFACDQESKQSPVPRYDRATLDMKYQAVHNLIQDLSCTDSSSCASIGVGSKPCGGPWSFLVYSKDAVDQEELTVTVADLNAYEAEYNAQEGIVSDCSMAREAKPGCVDHKCVDLNSLQ
jgi:hypothetical protein